MKIKYRDTIESQVIDLITNVVYIDRNDIHLIDYILLTKQEASQYLVEKGFHPEMLKEGEFVGSVYFTQERNVYRVPLFYPGDDDE